MPVSYQQEFLDNVKKDILPLLERHWEEVNEKGNELKLDPDWEIYKTLEGAGKLKIFTAREDDELIGYFVALIGKSIHSKSVWCAENDALYISPKYRKGFLGIKLIKFAEKCLKEDNIECMIITTTVYKPFDKLLSWLGFTHIESKYSKILR